MLLILLKKKIKRFINRIKVRNKQKIFCIGRNKTGTTSLKKAFENLGYIVGEQDVAENLFDQHFLNGNYQPIIDYCKSAQVFQDVPFSFYQALPHLDKAFPNSKFILTTRDTPEQWYNSFLKYYSKRVGIKGRAATYDELKQSNYVSNDFRIKFILGVHGTTPEDPFNKETLITEYQKHNEYIKNYFAKRSENYLEINISEKDSFQKFITFLNEKSSETSFPWENKTSS